MTRSPRSGPEPCWVCGGTDAELFLEGGLGEVLSPAELKITDASYGRCARLVRCRRCDFIYASPLPTDDLVALYEDLEDPEYAEGHDYRLLQMQALLSRLIDHAPGARTMLDVGAGTGLMVEAAQQRGLRAVGVEPSRSLVEEAERLGNRVLAGVLPHAELEGQTFDIVTCVDVIEHVSDPVGLLRTLHDATNPGGLVVVTTPDVDSLARRALGARWWHFRAAHVCFLPEPAMRRALAEASLEWFERRRQVWWFALPYLVARVGHLVPSRRGARAFERLAANVPSSVRIPLDLRDSWVYFCRRVT